MILRHLFRNFLYPKNRPIYASARSYSVLEGEVRALAAGFYDIGKENSPDVEKGLDKVCEGIEWLKKERPILEEKYKKDFPDAAQYEVFNFYEKEFEILIHGEMKTEIETMAWIHWFALGETTSLEKSMGYLKSLPVEVKYR